MIWVPLNMGTEQIQVYFILHGSILIPLSHLRTDAADRSAYSTDKISRREYGDSTDSVRSQYGLT